jgi:arabinofuranosyltransferase
MRPVLSAIWPASAITLVTLVLRLLPGPRPVDDAYITFRYARNLVRGFGLVYNPGQHVLGTSTPLFTLLLASLAAVTGLGIPWIALGVSAAADAATAVLVGWLAIRLTLPAWAGLVSSLAWCLYPVALRYAVGGMETSLATALVLGACALDLARRPGWASVVAGLAILTRPDLLALAFVILLSEGVQLRRCPWRSILILAAVLAPWLVFASWWYGTPVPQSLYAKSHAVYRASWPDNIFQILYFVSGLVLAGPMDVAAVGLGPHLAGSKRILAAAVSALLLGIWGLGAVSSVRADGRRLAMFALPPVFCVAYALIGLRGRLMAEWYLVPLAPLLFLGVVAGLVRLSLLAGRAARPVGATLAVAVVAAQLAGFGPSRSAPSGLVPRIVATEREDLYREAAKFLRPRLQPGAIVAASEIGALGYYCDCRILDTVGLVSPETIRYYPLPPELYVVNYAVPPRLVRDAAPDYLVSLDVFIRKSLAEADWFRRDYEVVWAADTEVFGSRRLLVFARVATSR